MGEPIFDFESMQRMHDLLVMYRGNCERLNKWREENFGGYVKIKVTPEIKELLNKSLIHYDPKEYPDIIILMGILEQIRKELNNQEET